MLISGASVAGPALAYWLRRYGFRTTVVEVAPALRGGGFAVDFRGAVHREVLERMGILDEIRRHATGGLPVRFIDASGRQVAGLPPEFAGGEVEVLRSELARLLYEHSLGTDGETADEWGPATEYVFGDSIASLSETEQGVDVTFERGAPRTFDLVVGADGLHSTVRRLAFGPEERFVSHLGYYVAGWELPDGAADFRGPSMAYNEPGLFASAGSTALDPDTTQAFCLFASEELAYDRRNTEQHKQLIAQAFSGGGWRTAELMASLRDAHDLYFDSISRVDVECWSTGRVVLIGDAAYGATLGGMGTGSAIVGAYVLAGELARAEGDHRTAFTRYEQEIRDYVTGCQEGGQHVGAFLAPTTQEAIDQRNAMLNDPAGLAAMLQAGEDISTDFTVRDYETAVRRTGRPPLAGAV
ncbi:FAD-dependent monooxygenase [Streptomyces sp. NPDC003077]|uniref:FAD-dependent monooxygenase n=1 Tax=Streptomyces sp. NPDC003077 TaxID=3154443 RepID=UPI00339E8778